MGESIAVNGACLTLESFEGGCGTFFISKETLSRTVLGNFKTGQCVNLEQSLRMGDRMGGHWVQGHIDTVGHILELYSDGNSYRLKVGMPVGFSRYLIEKGSVTLDGISLTINALGVTQTEAWVDIQIIPHTWVNTHLHTVAVGASMHVEVDVLAKYVEKLCRNDSTYLPSY